MNALLGNVVKNVSAKTAAETYFYWLLFGRTGYIGSTTFLRILPLHDIIWNCIQILIFSQMAWFFWDGPMLKIPWFCFAGIAANITLITAASIFYVNRTKELYSGRGFGYWFFYYSRLLCTLTCILLCTTFILTWGIRYWIVYKFDPNLTLNIVKDTNFILMSTTWLFFMVVVEAVVYCLMIFHHAQTLYMMRLFTESYDDLLDKVKVKASNL